MTWEIRPPQNSGQFLTVPWVFLIPRSHCIIANIVSYPWAPDPTIPHYWNCRGHAPKRAVVHWAVAYYVRRSRHDYIKTHPRRGVFVCCETSYSHIFTHCLQLQVHRMTQNDIENYTVKGTLHMFIYYLWITNFAPFRSTTACLLGIWVKFLGFLNNYDTMVIWHFWNKSLILETEDFKNAPRGFVRTIRWKIKRFEILSPYA